MPPPPPTSSSQPEQKQEPQPQATRPQQPTAQAEQPRPKPPTQPPPASLLPRSQQPKPMDVSSDEPPAKPAPMTSPPKPPHAAAAPPRLTPGEAFSSARQAVASSASSVAPSSVPSSTTRPFQQRHNQGRLSPVDTYEISDREESTDGESDDDSTRRPNKHVPTWARKDALEAALTKQQAVDPSRFFNMTAASCDLHKVFDTAAKPFKRRTSSQNWSQDLTTYNERQKYRQEMGFTPPK